VNARREPRARFAEVGREHREAVGRMLAARNDLAPVDIAVFAYVVARLASYSRLRDVLTVGDVAEAVGCTRPTANRALGRLARTGVLGWHGSRANRGTSGASRAALSPHVFAPDTSDVPPHVLTVDTCAAATGSPHVPATGSPHVPASDTSHVLASDTHTEENRGEGEGDPYTPDDADALTADEAHEVDAAQAARHVAERLGLAEALTADDRLALVAAMLTVPDDRLSAVVAGAVRRRPPRFVESPAGLALARVRDACEALGLEVPA